MDVIRILQHGALLSVVALAILLLTLYVNPRLYLQDYPHDIQSLAPPKTVREKRLGVLLGLPFLLALLAIPLWSTPWLRMEQTGLGLCALALHAAGVLWVFNWVDWLVLDWWLFCTVTSHFMVIPGSEGSPAYKDYLFHFRAFLIGTLISPLGGLAVAALAMWLV